MAIESGKPDFYTVLKRRNRSVADFLNDANISDMESLKPLLASLKNTYRISKAFEDEAIEHVSKTMTKKTSTVENKPKTKQSTSTKECEDDQNLQTQAKNEKSEPSKADSSASVKEKGTQKPKKKTSKTSSTKTKQTQRTKTKKESSGKKNKNNDSNDES